LIVIDASCVIDLLLRGPAFATIAARVQRARSLAAPHLLDVEVGQVLRRLERARLIQVGEVAAAVQDLAVLPVTRFAHGPLLGRALDLRNNVTVYDAMYLVLAEATGAPLVTRDRALATVPGHGATVEVI
jgi:predicted nucleic acid-binding protein